MAAIPRNAKRLVLFNHKGGVGKTTLTVNIAHALADAGKRVLLVDTDPQCSLSSFFLQEEYLDKILDGSDNPNGKTLWSALRPVSEGTGKAGVIKPEKIREGIFLAVGDIRLAEFENSLADCWNLCLSRNRRGYNCTSALSELVDDLVANTKADFVFFDAGPNIGPLNRVTLLDCTHFIVPAACDLFSTRALKTLGYALSEWISTWVRIREMAPDGIPLFRGEPQLLGYIPQAFRVYRGEIAATAEKALPTLENRVLEFVWKPLQSVYELPISERPTKTKLGQVKFFSSLVTEAQYQGLPLWEVKKGDPTAKAEARAVFSEIAKQVIARTT